MNELTTTTKEFSLSELTEMSKVMVNGGLFGYTKPEQVMSLMLIAQAEGRHPAKVAQDYSIIQGKPALNAQAMLSRFQEAGGKIKWVKSNDNECELWLWHPQGGEMTVRWDIERAKTAGLSGKNTWKQYPAQMMRARAISEGVRAIYPACLNGMYTPEEVRDFDTVAPEYKADNPTNTIQEKRCQVNDALIAKDAEIVDEKNVNQCPEIKKNDLDADTRAFVDAMGRWKKKNEKLFDEIWSRMNYEGYEKVPLDQRRTVINTIKLGMGGNNG